MVHGITDQDSAQKPDGKPIHCCAILTYRSDFTGKVIVSRQCDFARQQALSCGFLSDTATAQRDASPGNHPPPAAGRPQSQRVMRLHQPLQPLGQHMRVDLRRRDIGMAQQQSAGCAGRRRAPACGWRKSGAARAATRAPGSSPAASATCLSSRSNPCRVSAPLRIAAGKQPARSAAPRRATSAAAAPRAASDSGTIRSLPPLPRTSSTAASPASARARQAQQLGDPQPGRIEDLQRRPRHHAAAVRQRAAAAAAAPRPPPRSGISAARGGSAAHPAARSDRPAARPRAAGTGRTAAAPTAAAPRCAPTARRRAARPYRPAASPRRPAPAPRRARRRSRRNRPGRAA